MKFRTYNRVDEIYTEAEIEAANDGTAEDFKSWVRYCEQTKGSDPGFRYRLFNWDELILLSLTKAFEYKCFAACSGLKLEGLLSLRREERLYVDFIATAPWNYGQNGRLKMIGSGLVYFAIEISCDIGFDGEFFQFAIPDAEPFCRKIGMVLTGEINFGMREYFMSKNAASRFVEGFRENIVKEPLQFTL